MTQVLKLGDLFGVNGLVAVVTGGRSGIGLMIAQALEVNGAIVYIIGRRKATLDDAARTALGNIRPIQADVTSKFDLDRVVLEIRAAHSYIDVVIANAGVGGPSLVKLPPNPSI